MDKRRLTGDEVLARVEDDRSRSIEDARSQNSLVKFDQRSDQLGPVFRRECPQIYESVNSCLVPKQCKLCISMIWHMHKQSFAG